MTSYTEVPRMFQAQINGRCQLQRVENKHTDAISWAREWTNYYKALPSSSPTPTQDNVPVWKRRPVKVTTASPPPQPPQFGNQVKQWKYEINWRLVTDGGQDDAIIRPAIGAKGYPYFPGSSMKGAFRRACDHTQKERYCGKSDGDKTEPGILRFHGGYPVDNSWTENLVDIVHPQQPKQVEGEPPKSGNKPVKRKGKDKDKAGAMAQIALHEVEINFGFSSEYLAFDDPEWKIIQKIWEKALTRGLGSRVSAGYGGFVDFKHPEELLEVGLQGQGIFSTLLDKTPEFRPNMFKAALRGHTLRLLGGMSNAATAQKLTQQLWGGIDGKAVVGLLGVAFSWENLHPQTVSKTQVYNLEGGKLQIFCNCSGLDSSQKELLEKVARSLIQFSLLLGGFGKSWRRVHHQLFYPQYLQRPNKRMIGCHWRFTPDSGDFYFPVNRLSAVTTAIDELRNNLLSWSQTQPQFQRGFARSWREAWHKDKVKVWGRFAQEESLAVEWFHTEGEPHIKKTLAGEMGKTGRIWHRMYPHYVLGAEDILEAATDYKFVELLTIFPDDSDVSNKLPDFLRRKQFQQLW